MKKVVIVIFCFILLNPFIIRIWDKYVFDDYCIVRYVANNKHGCVLQGEVKFDYNNPADTIIINKITNILYDTKFDECRF